MDKIQESIVVRGIAAALQAMNFPSFENLAEMLKKYGFTLTKNTAPK